MQNLIGSRARFVTTFWRLSATATRSPRSQANSLPPPNSTRHYPSSSLWTGKLPTPKQFTKSSVNFGDSSFLSRCTTTSSSLMMGNKESKGEKVSELKDVGEYVEAVVAKAGDLKDGEMREVEIGEGKALLAYQGGEYMACGHKCTHYGAPLSKGYLGNGRVRCPWHGACFNVKTGDIEDFPGLDGIHSFETRVEGDGVVMRAKKSALSSHKCTLPMCPEATDEDKKTFVIIGGGPAGLECAETLRQEGFKGRIVMATRENVLPYDRPKLSKAMSVKVEDIVLRPPTFYEEHNIEVQMGKEATGLNTAEKTVAFADGTNIKYDTLFLATGSAPRTIPVPGINFENVFLLRDPSHANAINAAAEGKRVVLVGTGFIGMEVAASLSSKAASVTCIDLLEIPFIHILGDKVGTAIQKFQEEKGNITFELGVGLKEFVGQDGKLTGVAVGDGSKVIDADIAIVGIGVVPNTGFLKDSGLNLTRRGEVVVDEFMKAGEDVFAGGDIARFPLPLIGDTANIGHWQLAHKHGRVAAKNMLGKNQPYDSIPYFWTVLYGKSIRYCGHALQWDEIVMEGDPLKHKFVAYYVKDNKVLAVCSMNADPAVSMAAELMYQQKMPSGEEIKSNPGTFWPGKFVEAKVATVGDMQDGEMREVEIGEGKALLVYQGGEYMACGHKCTHYGAPLIKGALGNGRVRCPWHGACFNVKTGDIEDFPGLDGIAVHQVRVEGDGIFVKAETSKLAQFRQTMNMGKGQSAEDPRTFLIIGGGPSAQECAETLRQEKFKGRIVLATKESCRPYDRSAISKALHSSADKLAVRPATFYQHYSIEVLVNKEASGLNQAEKSVSFTDGTNIKYDTLFIGTGSAPRTLGVPGSDLQNIYYLRDPWQGNALLEAATGKRVVIVGAGFIGMEVAAYFHSKAQSVTCIGNGEPYQKVFGPAVGKALRKLQEDKGVKLIIGNGVKEFSGEDGKLVGVVLQTGETLEADVCLVGIGSTPTSGWLADSGLNITARGEVVVDKFMKAGEDVFAGGDIARFPLPLTSDTANIGHWQLAHKHGRVAAKNMLGKNQPYDSIPYFWTMIYGKSVRYCGHAHEWDEIVVDGYPDEFKFVAYYLKGPKVLAVSSMGSDPAVSKSAELMYQGKMYTADEIRNNPGILSPQ